MFYIAGFDPRGAAFYHQLYADNAAQQNGVHARAHATGHDGAGALQTFTVGPLEANARFNANWMVQSRPVADGGVNAAAPTLTHYTYLGWDDLARVNTPRGVKPALFGLWGFYTALWRSRSITGAWTHAKRFFGILITALTWLLLVLGGAALVTVSVIRGVQLAGWGNTPFAWAWLFGAAEGLAVLYGGWRQALRWRFVWLLHGLHYYLRWGMGQAPELDARLRGFAQTIAQDIHERSLLGDRSEVLMVGHCMGSSLVLVILDQVLGELDRLAAVPAAMPPIKLLTLANVIPMVTLVRHGDHVRRSLQAVAARQVPWLDFTSPHDPMCYALVDCVAVSGATPPPGSARTSYWPRSARFDKMFDPATYAALKKDPFRIHFQYLMASERPVDNDFFTLTAGPWPLEHWMDTA